MRLESKGPRETKQVRWGGNKGMCRAGPFPTGLAAIELVDTSMVPSSGRSFGNVQLPFFVALLLSRAFPVCSENLWMELTGDCYPLRTVLEFKPPAQSMWRIPESHFLLQCVKVAQSCPTLSDPMDCSLPGSSNPWDFPGTAPPVTLQ